MKNKINWKILVASFLIVFAVAFLGSLFTSSGTNSEWYNSIKPDITPPNWVFLIVWNILFILIALSLYFAWIYAKTTKRNGKIIFAFGINFILNILWSFLFFKLRNSVAAFMEIFILWASIIFLIYTASRIKRVAGYLLIPYLLWVSFAIVLNFLSMF